MTWKTIPNLVAQSGFGGIDAYPDWAFPDNTSSAATATAATTAATAQTGAPDQNEQGNSSDNANDNQPALYPVLLHLNGFSATDFANGAPLFANGTAPTDWHHCVRVPAIYRDPNNALGQRQYFTAHVTAKFFSYFDAAHAGPAIAASLRAAISRMTIAEPLSANSIAPDTIAPALTAKPGLAARPPEAGTVVVGIIDDGLAIANHRFATAQNKTRVEALWMQDGTFNAPAHAYGYGRLISKYTSDNAIGIDDILAKCTRNGTLDEDEFYRQIGMIDFANPLRTTIGLRSTHGVHIMDLASGYAPGEAPATNATKGEDSRPIVCVQLPAATTIDTSGASLDSYVVDAIRFIFEQADEIAARRGCGRLPVVINLSYGSIAGRHDGTADIERAIDECIEARCTEKQAPTDLVLPAGNDRLSQCHASVEFAQPGTVTQLLWRIHPDDTTPSHMEIWLPKSDLPANSRVKLRLIPPNGEPSIMLDEDCNNLHLWTPNNGPALCQIRYAYHPAPTGRGMFLITVRPTVAPFSAPVAAATAPAGLWTVELSNVSLTVTDAPIEAWIQRDDTPFGYNRGGRQSFFDHGDYHRVDDDGQRPRLDNETGLVRRAGTLNAIATGHHPVVIGGFTQQEMALAYYSAGGGTGAADRPGPDALALSDRSEIMGGILAAGTRSGSVVALNGTSVAAPQITRLIADFMAQGAPTGRAGIAARAQSEEAQNPGRPPLPPHSAPPHSGPRAGSGRIDLASALPVPKTG